MSKELKPCAHCGSELSEFCEDFYKVNRSGNDHWVYLRCLKCGAMTQGRGNTKEAAEQNARKRWNTRAERTCHPVSKSGEEFSFEDRSSTLTAWCSECHEYLGEACDVFSYHDRFCSGCGAKVVE